MNFRSVLQQWMTRETTSTVGSEAYNKKNLQKKQVYKHVDEETGEIYFSHHMSGKPVTGGSEDWSVKYTHQANHSILIAKLVEVRGQNRPFWILGHRTVPLFLTPFGMRRLMRQGTVIT